MTANDRQVGGDHYRKNGTDIQHWDYAISKKFDFFQYVITKYTERWRDKKGLEDLLKVQHYLEKYIEEVKKGTEFRAVSGEPLPARKELPPKVETANRDPYTNKGGGGIGQLHPFGCNLEHEL